MGNNSSLLCNESSVPLIADFIEVDKLSKFLLLNTNVPTAFQSRDGWYRYLCKKMKEDFGVYAPGPLNDKPPFGDEWLEFARMLYDAKKHMEGEIDDEHAVPKFQIGVVCRLTSRKIAPAEEDAQREIVLPLHQKVKLLKEKFPEFKISTSVALKAIMEERGRPPLKDHFQDADAKHKLFTETKKGGAEKANEKVASQASILSYTDKTILAVGQGMGLQNFEYDNVFGESSSQEEVYCDQIRRVVVDFINGQNGCIICYGQTGSGKTYTMFGPPELLLNCEGSPYRGIAPRAFRDIFKARGSTSSISVSYVEVFGNAINDLLNEGNIVGQNRPDRHASTRATDRVGHRYVLDGDTSVPVTSLEEVEEVLRQGAKFKRQAATQMNERSTRAHSVLIVNLKTQSKISGREVTSRLFLADLGGSERISRSKAGDQVKSLVAVVGEEETRLKFDEYYHHRERIQETMYINQGLFALKQVIKALLLRRDTADPNMRIPYWDNKLTMLLESGLGGSASKTVVVATLSMDPDSAYESLQTLKFAEACKNVDSETKKGDSAVLQLALEKIAKEIADSEEKIKEKERWEDVKEERIDRDTVAGGFGEDENIVTRKEFIVKSVLVGAEKEREKLENLLTRQRAMLGLDSLGKEFRQSLEKAKDGGLGADFRETTFSKKMKAKDFENLNLLADGLRFLFRKTGVAQSMCGETEDTMKKRLRTENISEQYHLWAQKLRDIYDNSEQHHGHSFGKAMLDQFKNFSTQDREEGVQSLLKILDRETLDHSPVEKVPPEHVSEEWEMI